MPEMDGYQATTALRQREAMGASHVPIVALTANAMVEDKQKCLDVGMDDYLSKPVNRAGIQQMLERWAPAERAGSPSECLADIKLA
jgi:CheY-like chemotaxis protein